MAPCWGTSRARRQAESGRAPSLSRVEQWTRCPWPPAGGPSAGTGHPEARGGGARVVAPSRLPHCAGLTAVRAGGPRRGVAPVSEHPSPCPAGAAHARTLASPQPVPATTSHHLTEPKPSRATVPWEHRTRLSLHCTPLRDAWPRGLCCDQAQGTQRPGPQEPGAGPGDSSQSLVPGWHGGH